MNLYIHVPFCVKKCNYCAFYSVCGDPDWDGYVREILGQLDYFHTSDYEIKTLFFGGGTPSLMPVGHAERIIKKLNISPGAEFTIEANPKTISSLDLKDWKDWGMNRLSIGMQSFDDRDLDFLGRIHSVADSMELLAAANDLGLRASGDFIYGLPDHSVSDVARLCERINASGLRHASLYELTMEPGTKFQNLRPVSESTGAEMYLAIQSALKLPRYEVSNYGDPCLHNSAVWSGGEYIGVGESAAGRIVRDGKWIETKIVVGRVRENELSLRDRKVEIAMTGLRTAGGVRVSEMRDIIDWDFVGAHPEYFARDSESLRMTNSGIMLLDGLLKYIIIFPVKHYVSFG
jgi:oxygen-independent coproporphyrinogen-3 oxidase